jgi:aminopeptidase N
VARVPDAVARAVVWVALLGAVHRAEVDPRAALDVFEAAWPVEENSSLLTRVATATTAEVLPLFLPPDEREAALARVADAAERRLVSAGDVEGAAGDALAVTAARVWARTSSDGDRLRRWAAGEGLPPALAGDDDFRWVVLRRLAALGELGEGEIEAAEAADRSLAGSLAALGVRAVRPTPEAKEWAWATLRDDEHLSNHAALAVAGAFWSAPDPALVRPWVDRVGDLLVALERRMADDALSRVASTLHPTRVVEEDTARATAAVLARDDLTVGVRRAFADADHVLHEALTSRRRFG